jgi:hypothetical protein
MLERVLGDAFVLFHPTQERRNGTEVFVQRLRRPVLFRSPSLKRIGGNIAKQFPAAVMNELADSIFQFVDVLDIAIQSAQVGNILHQMSLKRGLGCVSDGFRGNHA